MRFAKTIRSYVFDRRKKAFLAAVSSDDLDKVSSFLANGIDPNTQDQECRRSIRVANTPEMICKLIDSGANVDPNSTGIGFYQHVINKGMSHLNVLQLILRKLDFDNIQPKVIFEIIDGAKSQYHIDFGLELLCGLKEAGRLDRTRALNFISPIHLSSSSSSFRRTLRAYKDLGLAQLLRCNGSEGSLVTALEACDVDLVKDLLEAGADPIELTSDGKPALLVAAQHGLTRLYSHLRAPKTCVDNSDKNDLKEGIGDRSWKGVAKIKKYLEAGGDPEREVDGRKPLAVALDRCWEEAAALLISYGATIEDYPNVDDPPLARAASGESVALIRLLLWLGCDPNHCPDCGRLGQFPMLAASRLESISALVEGGGNVDFQSSYGRESPMTLAASREDVDVVKYLVRKGANVQTQSASGWTPLHWAVMGNKAGTTKLMLELGVDPMTLDLTGETALDIAMKMQHFDLAVLIRDAGAFDRYSAPYEWLDGIIPSRFDYFISYRHKLALEPAHKLARDLRAAGCRVYLDSDTCGIQVNSIADDNKVLMREIFIGVKSSDVVLFFESALEVEPIPEENKTQIAFSWTVFEKSHANQFNLMGRGYVDQSSVDRLATSAADRRAMSGAEPSPFIRGAL